MTSYGQAVPAAGLRPVSYGAPIAPSAGAPAGTFSPGTKIQVGNHRVVIQKYLSEGGFAHVYLVKLQTAVNGTDLAVLKRVAVPDKESLRGMATEVETIKRLKGHKAIVTYIDSHASELRSGGYEVFLLMEYCNGGGLIDFMNTRLQHRLTEPEILTIFADVAEGVACMHYLRPPLLHRDLKVENVLITVTGSSRKFKLCDFGSAAAPRPAPTTVVECRLMDEDVQKHTTMQYRSPEMIDVYRKQPIDEKSDIWALGVLLYKLCYYTTPFEEQGQLAILNASYKFPAYPVFSDRLKKLIAWMLRENQQSRPNIYQVLREACAMQGREPPVKDIYSGTSQADSRAYQETPQTQKVQSPPTVGAVFSRQPVQQPVIPEVERMRRGRLPVSQPASQPARPSPSPATVTNGDPFAALDAKIPPGGGDELSNRFPTLDQFSILHEHGTKFDFDNATPQPAQQPKDLSQRVTERLADEAFQTRPSPSPGPSSANHRQSVELNRPNAYGAASAVDAQRVSPPLKSASAPPKQQEMSRASTIISSTPELKAISSQTSQPIVSKPQMVSTGTMTTPPPEQSYQSFRFPPSERHRASSMPRQQDTVTPPTMLTRTDTPGSSRHGLRATSLQGQANHIRHPSSSRPSLEGGRPSQDLLEPTARSNQRDLSLRPRPVSTHLESNLDYLREREGISKPLGSPGLQSPRYSFDKDLPPSPHSEEETNIQSNVEFLRSMESSSDHLKKKDKNHHVKHHIKRSSLSSLGAGTKNILAGKFGDAFKRFEGSGQAGSVPARTPSPLKDLEKRPGNLTPIAGSEATDGRSDDVQRDFTGYNDPDQMTPEMRREQEARMLAQEEARVAAAQAEYRQRVAQRPATSSGSKSTGGVSRAVAIQNKVQSLLDESSRGSSSSVTRTAQGYGHYTDAAAAGTTAQRPGTGDGEGRPPVGRKPTGYGGGGVSERLSTMNLAGSGSSIEPSATGRTTNSINMGGARPAAPPKPMHLNRTVTNNSNNLTGGGIIRAGSPPKPHHLTGNRGSNDSMAGNRGSTSSISGVKVRGTTSVEREALLAVELPGKPGQSALLQMTASEKDDYVRDFQKRFPSLGSIELVERDLGPADLDRGDNRGSRDEGSRR